MSRLNRIKNNYDESIFKMFKAQLEISKNTNIQQYFIENKVHSIREKVEYTKALSTYHKLDNDPVDTELVIQINGHICFFLK